MTGGVFLVELCFFSFILLHFSTFCDVYIVNRLYTRILTAAYINLYSMQLLKVSFFKKKLCEQLKAEVVLIMQEKLLVYYGCIMIFRICII